MEREEGLDFIKNLVGNWSLLGWDSGYKISSRKVKHFRS